MKKELWVQLDKADKALVTACLEAGVDALVLLESGQPSLSAGSARSKSSRRTGT